MDLLEKLNIEKLNVPALTEEHLASLEKLVGNKLPTLYRQLLLVYNGGFPNAVNVFRNNDREFLFSHFFYLKNPQIVSLDQENEILSEYKAMMTELPKNYLPFAAEPTGDVYVFDTIFGENAPVYIWLHDDSDEGLIKLADSFKDFISNLKYDSEYD